MSKIKCNYDPRFFKLTENGDWGIVLAKISWNGNFPTFNIRNAKISALESGETEGYIFGKGISLSDEACEELTKALIMSGFIDKDEVLKILNKRDNIFTEVSNKKKPEEIKIIFKKKV